MPRCEGGAVMGVQLAVSACASLAVALTAGGWAIAPGHEALFSAVTSPGEGELPEGWGRRAISVPRDRVEVLYGPKDTPKSIRCEEAPLCLTLTHPDLAPKGAPKAGPFAITSRAAADGVSGAALVEGVRARIAERSPPSPFMAIKVMLPEVGVASDAEVVTETPESGGELAGRFAEMLSSDVELHGRILRVDVTPELVRYVLRMESGEPPEAIVELRNRAFLCARGWRRDGSTGSRSPSPRGCARR